MVKRILGSVRQYKRVSILTPLFMVGEVAMEVMIPYLMAKIIDEGITQGDMAIITRVGLLMLLATLASMIFGSLCGFFGAEASTGLAQNLRHDIFYNIQDFSFANIDKFSTSSLVTRLTTDITNIQNAYQMILRMAVRGPCMLLFSLFMAFRVNPTLSLIFLAAVPILGIGLYLIIRNAHPLFEKVFKVYDKLNAVVQENLRGIRVVKSYVREEHEINKFAEVSERIYRLFSKAERILAFNSPLMQFAMYGCILLISWFGAQMIVSDSMTTGQLMSLITYSTQILSSLMMLSMVFVMITISRASGERVAEVLAEQSSLVGGDVKAVRDGSITFNNVEFSYAGKGGKLCLADINLEIKSGQTVGIVGGTGSSKSTLVQLIPRLYDTTEGIVYVGGRDVREYDLDALRDSVAMVLQKNTLFSGTIKGNLRWGNPEATDEELEHACRLAQAHDFVMAFPDGYDTVIEQGGSNVSGGQKQRLCIARALLKKPKILILDDSTSAVDTRTDAQIRRAFVEEIPDTTKIIIAQRISSIEHADQIIVMDEGRINAVGTHKELLEANDIYREVYTSQQKGKGGDEDGAA